MIENAKTFPAPKYQGKPLIDPSEIDKAREWRVSYEFLEVLRAVYKYGMKISRAAKANGYNVGWARQVIWRLRKEGWEEDIKQSLKMYNEADGDKIFYGKLVNAMKLGDIEAMKLYAQMRGFIKQGQTVGQQTNMLVNTFMLNKKLLGDKDDQEEG